MRDTPRTEVYVLDPLPQVVSADWARQLERELNAAKARSAELEARCKRLEEAARAVYLDSIASDHPWTEPETRNMRALRDVLEAKP